MSTLIEFTGTNNQLTEVSAATPLPVTLIGGGGSTVDQGAPNAGGALAWPVSIADEVAVKNGAASFGVQINSGSVQQGASNGGGDPWYVQGNVGITGSVDVNINASNGDDITASNNALDINMTFAGTDLGFSGDSAHVRLQTTSNTDIDYGTGSISSNTIKVVIADDQPAVTIRPNHHQGTDSSNSGTGVIIGPFTLTDPEQNFSLQVTDNAASTWDVRLEGSLDGTTYTQILQHTTVLGSGTLVVSGASAPVLYWQVNIISNTGTITTGALGMN